MVGVVIRVGTARQNASFTFLEVTVVLPRMTAHKAATIEPTTQEPIRKVRAAKNRLPSKSIALSSIHRSFQL
jgi:hypothetical protein